MVPDPNRPWVASGWRQSSSENPHTQQQQSCRPTPTPSQATTQTVRNLKPEYVENENTTGWQPAQEERGIYNPKCLPSISNKEHLLTPQVSTSRGKETDKREHQRDKRLLPQTVKQVPKLLTKIRTTQLSVSGKKRSSLP